MWIGNSVNHHLATRGQDLVRCPVAGLGRFVACGPYIRLRDLARVRRDHERAQAKARKVEPKLLIVKHPVGGLNEAELRERIDTAFGELKQAVID